MERCPPPTSRALLAFTAASFAFPGPARRPAPSANTPNSRDALRSSGRPAVARPELPNPQVEGGATTRSIPRAPRRSIHRYYDPGTGQFVSVDPMLDMTGQPYSFADDNPVDTADPSGGSPQQTYPRDFGDYYSPIDKARNFHLVIHYENGEGPPQTCLVTVDLYNIDALNTARASLELIRGSCNTTGEHDSLAYVQAEGREEDGHINKGEPDYVSDFGEPGFAIAGGKVWQANLRVCQETPYGQTATYSCAEWHISPRFDNKSQILSGVYDSGVD